MKKEFLKLWFDLITKYYSNDKRSNKLLLNYLHFIARIFWMLKVPVNHKLMQPGRINDLHLYPYVFDFQYLFLMKVFTYCFEQSIQFLSYNDNSQGSFVSWSSLLEKKSVISCSKVCFSHASANLSLDCLVKLF